MKSQAPNPKSQRSSKSQVPKLGRDSLSYSDTESASARAKGELNGSGAQRPFQLEERTAQSGETIVRFSKRIARNPTNNRLIDQLVGCGTAIGANYCEADERVSKRDFRCTIGRCVKEATETKYFLRLIAAAEPLLAVEARQLFREAKELHLIFASIFRK